MEILKVTRYLDACEILANENSISSRKEENYQIVGELDPHFGAKFRQFFQQWPMYNDGSQHAEMRRSLLVVMREYQYSQREKFRRFIYEKLSQGRLSEEDVKTIVLRWHSTYFGIDEADDAELMAVSEPLLMLMFYQKYELLEAASVALEEIERFFDRRRYQAFGLVDKMFNAGVEYGTVMNFLVDSYSPMIAGATSVFYHALAAPVRLATKDERREMIWQIIAALPPFRYVNRHILISEKETICTEIDVLSCNRDLSNSNLTDSRKRIPLTFGIGRHMCLGFMPAMDLFDDILVAVSEIPARRGSLSGCPVDTGSICTVSGFKYEC